MAFLQAHAVALLSTLLAVSEALAIWVPQSGGILVGLANILKLLGAQEPKDPVA